MTRLGSVDAAPTRALEQEKREKKGLLGLPFSLNNRSFENKRKSLDHPFVFFVAQKRR